MLERINNSSDVKDLSTSELKVLAKEIRTLILDTVLENGGHLASSLGIVECIIGMHYVFNPPYDKFIFDVGHQCYAHKILTGRKEQFATLRKKGGISGFPKRNESEYDTVDTGHSSTSISIGCGLARAAHINNENREIVTVIGDGALSGGLSYEALNDASDIHHRQIVILNDNSMSITKNVGSMANFLMKLHDNDVYRSAKHATIEFIDSLKIADRDKAYSFMYKFRNAVKYFLQGGLPFSEYGFRYVGPVDGNNIEEVINTLKTVKSYDENVIIHLVTKKGYGYLEAEENPSKYHGYSPNKSCGKSFSIAFGEKIVDMATHDKKIFGITAAMSTGTGLNLLEQSLPEQFADVGIAEGHAVCMSAGLALGGMKPYVALYSTFLQRAYDQVIHDVALQDLPVTFCIDRAGVVPDDGATHQGIYDVGFMSVVPNMTIIAPKDIRELNAVMDYSLTFEHPLVIRYPKGSFLTDDRYIDDNIKYGKWQILENCGSKITLVAMGALMVREALSAYAILRDKGIEVNVINARFVKPIDSEMIDSLNGGIIVTLEDNLLSGGLGSMVLEHVVDNGLDIEVKRLGITDAIMGQAKVDEILDDYGLSANKITEYVESNIIA